MPSAAVETAFQAKLASDWTVSLVKDVDEVTEAPNNAEAFLEVQYPVVTSRKLVLGRKYAEDGVARMVLSVKRGLGLAQALTWADTLAEIFREKKLGGGLETFVPGAPIVNDTNDNGLWFSLSVLVPYRYQFTSP